MVNDFINEYSRFIGIFFLFSVGYILMNIGFGIWYKIIPNKEDQEFYIRIILKISDLLLLSSWSVFIDNAPRGIVIKDFINNQGDFNKLILTTIWPKKYTSIKN